MSSTPADLDEKALAVAREIVALDKQTFVGGETQKLARVQVMLRDAFAVDMVKLREANKHISTAAYQQAQELVSLRALLEQLGDFIEREINARAEGAFDEKDEYMAEPRRLLAAIESALAQPRKNAPAPAATALAPRPIIEALVAIAPPGPEKDRGVAWLNQEGGPT